MFCINQSNLAVELVGQFLCPVTGRLLKPLNKKKCTVHDMSASRYYKNKYIGEVKFPYLNKSYMRNGMSVTNNVCRKSEISLL